MTETTLAPPARQSQARAPRKPRGFRDSSLVQLTLVRYREFLREPEAVFWVFVFPVLLAAGLGIAFRNRPAEKQHVAVLSTAPGAAPLAAALRSDSSLNVDLLDDSAAAQALRTGEVALVVVPQSAGAV